MREIFEPTAHLGSTGKTAYLMKESVYIKTLGCKVNTFDSQALANQLQSAGYAIVDNQNLADISIINSCSVTANAEKEARYLLRKYKRDNPNGKRIITGCYAQIDSASLAEMNEVDFVVPNEAKERLVDIFREERQRSTWDQNPKSKLPSFVKAVKDNRQSHFKSSLTLFGKALSSQTRAFIKIQDGCNGFCSYCQIPYARGASRSVAPARVLEEIREVSKSGISEVVFTGIHIGDYGEDLKEQKVGEIASFCELLDKILDEKLIPRIRISSLEPAEFTEDLAALMEKHKDVFCDHFHFPLQSGSTSVLKRMNRKYSPQVYAASVERARRVFKDPFIGADVIPGFPGETPEEFHETVEFIKKCELSQLHVFPYSKRPNTAAARMPSHIAPEIVKERASSLRQLSSQLTADYYKNQIGKSVSVVWESSKDEEGRPLGKSTNYLNAALPTSYTRASGQIDRVKIKGLLSKEKVLVIPE